MYDSFLDLHGFRRAHHRFANQIENIAKLDSACVKGRRIITIINHVIKGENNFRTDEGLLDVEPTSVLVNNHKPSGK